MKELCKILLLILTLSLPSPAQDGYGFLNFVNMIPGDGSCEIRIDSKNPAGDGLKSANDTGWFLFPVGSRSLTITSGELKEAKGDLTIEEGVGSLIAIYLEANPKPQKDGKPSPPLIRIRSFPNYNAEGLALRFVSLCQVDNRFQLGTVRLNVEPFKTVEVPGWNGAGFVVKKNGKDIGKIPDMREKEPHYLIAATDLEGNYTVALVYGGGVKVPPWRQKKKSEEPAYQP